MLKKVGGQVRSGMGGRGVAVGRKGVGWLVAMLVVGRMCGMGDVSQK